MPHCPWQHVHAWSAPASSLCAPYSSIYPASCHSPTANRSSDLRGHRRVHVYVWRSPAPIGHDSSTEAELLGVTWPLALGRRAEEDIPATDGWQPQARRCRVRRGRGGAKVPLRGEIQERVVLSTSSAESLQHWVRGAYVVRGIRCHRFGDQDALGTEVIARKAEALPGRLRPLIGLWDVCPRHHRDGGAR